MEYLIEFEIDVVNKKSFVSRKNGEIEITSELSIKALELPENENTINI